MLVKSEKDCTWPDYVFVIGGGRWARVLLEVTCSLTPVSVKIYVCSPRNFTSMEEWVLATGLGDRIQVRSDYPKTISCKNGAVIVANAAYHHEKAIKWALYQRLPVLVEKPVTLSFSATQRMVDLANSQRTYFATAHVFLFASYIENFSKLVSSQGGIVSIRVLWTDPRIECRYGETKNYDAGLPVYADCLPHIISILSTFIIRPAKLSENIGFFRGGEHLRINLLYGQISCLIEMARNQDSRQRIIEVNTEKRKITLDFSREPGVIYTDSEGQCGDKYWNHKPKPVSNMLSAFLQTAAGGNSDSRLDHSIGLTANQLIDQTTTFYRAAFWTWLNSELKKNQDTIKSDLRYALSEILQMRDSDSVVPIEQRINYLYQNLKGFIFRSNKATIIPIEYAIYLIIKQGKTTSYL